MGKIYKYAGPGNLAKLFAIDDAVSLRCSRPEHFNDPYELFLSIGLDEEPDALAFYSEVIGRIPQRPTTCFSVSPYVLPMWAHYAQNLEGFVIQFEESEIIDKFPEANFSDVEYLDEPDDGLRNMLHRASVIGKPRYLYFLQNAVLSAAYFTKLTCWSYEKERRMVVTDAETRMLKDVILLDVPRASVTAIIAGPRASPETINAIRAKTKELGCGYYKLTIGRSSAIPYLVDAEDTPFLFNGEQLVHSPKNCPSCQEPIAETTSSCMWCRIKESHRLSAANRNVFRTYARYGLLDQYLKGAEAIGKAKK